MSSFQKYKFYKKIRSENIALKIRDTHAVQNKRCELTRRFESLLNKCLNPKIWVGA